MGKSGNLYFKKHPKMAVMQTHISGAALQGMLEVESRSWKSSWYSNSEHLRYLIALSRGVFTKRTAIWDLHGAQIARDLQGSYNVVLLARKKGNAFLFVFKPSPVLPWFLYFSF